MICSYEVPRQQCEIDLDRTRMTREREAPKTHHTEHQEGIRQCMNKNALLLPTLGGFIVSPRVQDQRNSKIEQSYW